MKRTPIQHRRRLRPALALLPAGMCLALAGCTRDLQYQPLGMWDRARLKSMEASPRPSEISLVREPIPGTVARGELPVDDPIRTGRRDGKLVTESPIPVTPKLLKRGQERFQIYCSACHGRLGDGEGMAVKRGFPHPPDYAIPRLRKAALGHFFDVMTHGYGVMYSQAQSVPPHDRWAIASYIRVLQKQRPVVPVDEWAEQRKRARGLGIPDPAARPIKEDGTLAAPGEHGGESGHGGEGGHGSQPAAPAAGGGH